MKKAFFNLILIFLISFLNVSCDAGRNSVTLVDQDNYWLSCKVIHQKMPSVPLSQNTFHIKPAEAERLRSTFKNVLSKKEASRLSIPTVKNFFTQLKKEGSTNLKLIFDKSLESPIYFRFSRQIKRKSPKKPGANSRSILIIETFSTDKQLPRWTLNMLESLIVESIPAAFIAGLAGVTAVSAFCMSTLYSIARKSIVPFRNLYIKKHTKYPDIISEIGKQIAFHEQIEEGNCLIRDLVEKSRLIPTSPISWLTNKKLVPFPDNLTFACLGAPFTKSLDELLCPEINRTIPKRLVLVIPESALSHEYFLKIKELLTTLQQAGKSLSLVILKLRDDFQNDNSSALEKLNTLSGGVSWILAEEKSTHELLVISSSSKEEKRVFSDAKNAFELAQAVTCNYQELNVERVSQAIKSEKIGPEANLLIFDEKTGFLYIAKPYEPISFGLFFCKDTNAFKLAREGDKITLCDQTFNVKADFLYNKIKSINPLEIIKLENESFTTSLARTLKVAISRINGQEAPPAIVAISRPTTPSPSYRRLTSDISPAGGSPGRQTWDEVPSTELFHAVYHENDATKNIHETLTQIAQEITEQSPVIIFIYLRAIIDQNVEVTKQLKTTLYEHIKGLTTLNSFALLFLQDTKFSPPRQRDLSSEFNFTTSPAIMSISDAEKSALKIIEGKTQELLTGGTLEIPAKINLAPLLEGRENLKCLIDALPEAQVHYINFAPGI
jgi:hypothetical protein